MSWVRRTAETPPHRCDLPMRGEQFAGGRPGDLWRCDGCGDLWRVGWLCTACDYYGGRGTPHRGQCAIGTAWYPATLWQRIRYRGRNRPPSQIDPDQPLADWEREYLEQQEIERGSR